MSTTKYLETVIRCNLDSLLGMCNEMSLYFKGNFMSVYFKGNVVAVLRSVRTSPQKLLRRVEVFDIDLRPRGHGFDP